MDVIGHVARTEGSDNGLHVADHTSKAGGDLHWRAELRAGAHGIAHRQAQEDLRMCLPGREVVFGAGPLQRVTARRL